MNRLIVIACLVFSAEVCLAIQSHQGGRKILAGANANCSETQVIDQISQALGPALLGVKSRHQIYFVTVGNRVSFHVNKIAQADCIEWAEADEEMLSEYSQRGDAQSSPAVDDGRPDRVLPILPNDFHYQAGHQWNLNNINAPYAWRYGTGSEEVIVALLDSGIRLDHEDLHENLWRNPREELNGIDDDNNGYVDDIHGLAAASNGDLTDNIGHGTKVAGFVGGMGNNEIGIAGVNWKVSIMMLKRENPQNVASLATLVESILYAIDQGARVINMSFRYPNRRALEAAVVVALQNGVIITCSAGNTAEDNDLVGHYPSDYPYENIISVAASTPNDTLAGFSNWGLESVDIAAPGVAQTTTAANGGYANGGGTSFAAPQVAGAAAWIWSVRPDLSFEEVRKLILDQSRRSDALASKIATGGILDLGRIAEALRNPPQED